MKGLALLVRFLLELALLAACVVALGWLVGLGVAVLVAVVWGLFLAPRARLVLATPVRLAIEIGLFVLAGVALVATGQLAFGLVLVGVYALDRLALLAIGEPAYGSPGLG